MAYPEDSAQDPAGIL